MERALGWGKEMRGKVRGLYRKFAARVGEEIPSIQAGLFPSRVLLDDDTEKMSRTLPREPWVSAGGRGEARLRCWAGRAGCIDGP